MKLFIMYEKSELMKNYANFNESIEKDWDVNLIYAKALERELRKYQYFEVIGPIEIGEAQLLEEENEYEEVEKHQPDLIIQLAVCSKPITQIQKLKQLIYRLEGYKYTLFIPMNTTDEITTLVQLLDEFLTKKAVVNNFIQLERLPYKNMFKYSPGNVLNGAQIEEMLKEEVINSFSMSCTAALKSIFITKNV